jgi:hypothetical protein
MVFSELPLKKEIVTVSLVVKRKNVQPEAHIG